MLVSQKITLIDFVNSIKDPVMFLRSNYNSGEELAFFGGYTEFEDPILEFSGFVSRDGQRWEWDGQGATQYVIIQCREDATEWVRQNKEFQEVT